MPGENAITVAEKSGLSAQRLLQLDPEYRDLLMVGIRDLWTAEQRVTESHDDMVSLKRRWRDAESAYFWAITRRDRIRRDLSALLPELEAIQQARGVRGIQS